MEELKVQYLGINKIKPYKNNPRDNKNAVDYVVNSIKAFGFRVPLVLDAQHEIVAGHTRYEAAKRLKIQALPVVMAEDLSEEQIKAFRLADNQTQTLSSWDFSSLMTELDKIDEFDMSLFGFAKFDDDVGEEYSGKTSNLDHGKELDLNQFEEDELNCVCPHCGFRFSDE